MTANDATTDAGPARDAFLAGLGIEYRAEFVPQRLSRNAGEKSPSLNWRVTLARNGVVLSTDYMQGIGHIPGHTFGKETQYLRNYHESVAATGKYAPNGPESIWRRSLPAPLLADVLYSLRLDTEVLDYATYEEWVAEFGYDPDSRKGEAVYHACWAIAVPFRKMFTAEEWEALATHFEDY